MILPKGFVHVALLRLIQIIEEIRY